MNTDNRTTEVLWKSALTALVLPIRRVITRKVTSVILRVLEALLSWIHEHDNTNPKDAFRDADSRESAN